MIRTVPIEIEGRVYPLRKTLNVTEWMVGKYGNLKNMLQVVVSEASSVSALLDIIAELMKQGAAYEARFGNPEAWAQDEDGNLAVLSRDDLGLVCDDGYLGMFIEKILEAYDLAVKEEISATETAETKKAKKKDK